MRCPATDFTTVLDRLTDQNIFQNHWNIYNKTNIFHPYAISQNERDYPNLKKSKGRPYGTSCNTFQQIDINSSPTIFDLYTKHTIFCHPSAISHKKSDCKVLKKILGKILP